MFKHTKYFDYQVQGARSENCILINVENWLANTSNDIIGINSRGGIAENNITEVLDTNIDTDNEYKGILNAGDYVMLNKLANMYCARPYTIPVAYDSTQYTDIPVSCVLGKFENNKISFSTFTMLGKNVLLKRVPPNEVDIVNNVQVTTEPTKTIYDVIKVGPKTELVKVGQRVLLRDNVTVEIYLDGIQYFTADEETIIGLITDNDLTIEPIQDCIIMKEYVLETAAGSDVILNPIYDINNDKDHRSEIYTDTTYKVLYSADKSVDKDDIVYMSRYLLSYVTIRGVRYYVCYGHKDILATIKEN